MYLRDKMTKEQQAAVPKGRMTMTLAVNDEAVKVEIPDAYDEMGVAIDHGACPSLLIPMIRSVLNQIKDAENLNLELVVRFNKSK